VKARIFRAKNRDRGAKAGDNADLEGRDWEKKESMAAPENPFPRKAETQKNGEERAERNM